MPERYAPENEFSRARLAWPPLALVATLVGSSFFSPTAPAGPDIDGFDKLAHFLVFGLLGTLVYRAVGSGLGWWRRFFWALFGALAYAGLDELLQYFNPQRSFDPWDWLADLIGAVLAIFLYRHWSWYRCLLEYKFGRRLAK